MKNFEIKCIYTQQHDTVATFIRQVIELVLHLDKHSWVAKEGWAMTEYVDADGDLCIDLTFLFNSASLSHDGLEITIFSAVCGDFCGDAVRIYGGGSPPRTPQKQWTGRKKEKSNELNQS